MRNKICGVYLITNNLNGMSYCGQSIDNHMRFWQHKHFTHPNTLIDQVIKEVGVENFTFRTLLECPPDMLDVWERDMIYLFNTIYPNGYNKKSGGKRDCILCEDALKKRSKTITGHPGYFKGCHHKEESKKKTSEKLKGRSSPMKNKHHTEISKRKLSEKMTGISKPRQKYLTPSGEIREMSSQSAGRWHPDWIKLEE